MNLTYILGTAGSGKSTLTKALLDFMELFNPNVSCIAMNLDPGVRYLPYNPHVDVRDFVDVNEVIAKYKLGPNGALIVATDLMISSIDDIVDELDEYNYPEWVFVDTPGQMELFAFRNVGPMIAHSLGKDARNAVAFLFDPNLCKRPTGFLSTLLLATSVEYRFRDVPQANILSKSDLFDPAEIDAILEWSRDYDLLMEAASTQSKGIQRVLNMELGGLFRVLGGQGGLIPATCKRENGVELLFGQLQRLFAEDDSGYY